MDNPTRKDHDRELFDRLSLKNRRNTINLNSKHLLEILKGVLKFFHQTVVQNHLQRSQSERTCHVPNVNTPLKPLTEQIG